MKNTLACISLLLTTLLGSHGADLPNILWVTSEDNGPHLGCYGDDYAYFESAHGTAPDIAGQNIINPTATILSACMMLEYLAFEEAATMLKSSLSQIYAEGNLLTKDQGGSATTTQFCDAIKGLVE